MNDAPINNTGWSLCVAALASAAVCTASGASVFPHTDPSNTGGWALNTDISDEFEGEALDQDKWHIQGTDGFYYSNFIGRAPSQFSTDNARVEDGKLKIQTRWEPDFDFHDQPDRDGRAYENITTAAVIGNNTFQYGYMEIMAKPADISVASSFWMTGNDGTDYAEVDVFEHLGNPSFNKPYLETEMWSSVHDWSNPPPNSVWTERTQLPFRVADDFHVYGCDWSSEGLKFYADGQLIHEVLASDVPDWPVDVPLRVWVDSETFPWHGLPSAGDLPADYEIEYIRVWQKAGLPGDANEDGFVGIGDLNLVLSIWNSDGSLDPRADLNTDGFVGIDDLNTVLGSWNSGTPPATDVNIPEPSTLVLLGFSGMTFMRRSKRLDIQSVNVERSMRATWYA